MYVGTGLEGPPWSKAYLLFLIVLSMGFLPSCSDTVLGTGTEVAFVDRRRLLPVPLPRIWLIFLFGPAVGRKEGEGGCGQEKGVKICLVAGPVVC